MAKNKKKIAKKTIAKKAPAKKVVAKKTAAKKTVAKKVVAKKVAPLKKTAKVKAAKSPIVKKAVASQKAKIAPVKKTTPAKILDLSGFVTPLDDRLIVQVAAMEKMTAGGLYIPDTVASVTGHLKGTVLAVGRGHRDVKGRIRPMDVQQGDQVVFSEYSGSKIKIQEQDLMIVRETDILGILS